MPPKWLRNRFRRPLGASWWLLGPTWPLWAPLGALLGPLGRLLDRFWAEKALKTETWLSWNGKRVQRESRKHCKRRKTPGEKQERQEKREHRATRSSKADVARATRASRLQAEWIAVCPCSAAARPSPGAWSWDRFARLLPCQLASKRLRKWLQNAARSLQNRAKMAPGGLPEATPRAQPKMVTFFAPYFRLSGGSWGALGVLLAPLGAVLAPLGPLLRPPGALLGSI